MINRIQSYKSGHTLDIKKENTNFVTLVPNISETSNIYYQCKMLNDTPDSVPATFQESRPSPIIDVMSNYKLAIIKFTVSANSIPMFIVGDQVQYIGYRIEADNIFTLRRPFPGQDGRFIFNINQYLDEVDGFNETSTIAFNDLIAAYDLIYGPGAYIANAALPQAPAKLVFDEVTQLFTLYADERMSDVSNTVRLFFSYSMVKLVKGLNFILTPTFVQSPLPNIKGLYASIKYKPFNSNQYINGPITYIVSVAEYNTCSAWFFTDTLLLISNSLTTRNSFVATPTTTSGSSSNVNLPIVSDFTINLDYSPSSNPTTKLEYYPSAEYRWIDLIGDNQLSNVDIEFRIQTREGRIFPLIISSGDYFSVSMLFTRRSF